MADDAMVESPKDKKATKRDAIVTLAVLLLALWYLDAYGIVSGLFANPAPKVTMSVQDFKVVVPDGRAAIDPETDTATVSVKNIGFDESEITSAAAYNPRGIRCGLHTALPIRLGPDERANLSLTGCGIKDAGSDASFRIYLIMNGTSTLRSSIGTDQKVTTSPPGAIPQKTISGLKDKRNEKIAEMAGGKRDIQFTSRGYA
jgi:hypothetical protein